MKSYLFTDPVTGSSLKIGKVCKNWRIRSTSYKISDISSELNYTEDNIRKFEQGANNNLNIFLWYIVHGFNLLLLRPFRLSEMEVDDK